MTPKEAAGALIAAIPCGVSVQQLEEYGVTATTVQAQIITQEVLSLNLFWILAAIDAHIPLKYQAALSEFILKTLKIGWGTTIPVGATDWATYCIDLEDRRRQYNGLVEDGLNPLGVSAKAAELMEESHVVREDECGNLLTLLIDFVPANIYGQLLHDVG